MLNKGILSMHLHVKHAINQATNQHNNLYEYTIFNKQWYTPDADAYFEIEYMRNISTKSIPIYKEKWYTLMQYYIHLTYSHFDCIMIIASSPRKSIQYQCQCQMVMLITYSPLDSIQNNNERILSKLVVWKLEFFI